MTAIRSGALIQFAHLCSTYGGLVSVTFISVAIMYLKVKVRTVVNRVVHNIVPKEVLDRIA